MSVINSNISALRASNASVAAEKLLPAGPWLSRGSALVLIGWGLWILAGAVSSAA